MAIKDSPILITGSHRSGTTWVGKVISTAPKVGYINEPFNIERFPSLTTPTLKYWFTYLNNEIGTEYVKGINDTFNFTIPSNKVLLSKSLTDIIKFGYRSLFYKYYKVFSYRPLIKDPIALLSAEWIHQNFDTDVIVMIRHPAAFISSLVRADWNFDFNHFKNQPLLLDKLPEFKPEIEKFSQSKFDIVNQGILLWSIFHKFVLEYQKKYPQWIYVRHEDISLDPLHQFQNIFNKINLPFEKNSVQFILKTSTAKSNKQSLVSIYRNSKLNVKYWKNFLNKQQISLIKEKVSPISEVFYSEDDW